MGSKSTTTIYFILCDFGTNGQAFVERDTLEMDFDTTCVDVASGQWDKVVGVWQVDLLTKRWDDVTEAVMTRVDELKEDANG